MYLYERVDCGKGFAMCARYSLVCKTVLSKAVYKKVHTPDLIKSVKKIAYCQFPFRFLPWKLSFKPRLEL